MPVATTMFQVGFKGHSVDEPTNYRNQILDEVLNEIVAGEGSSLYRELYDQGLINNTFGTEVMCGRDYMALIFGGESKDPDKVYEAICREFDRFKAEGSPLPTSSGARSRCTASTSASSAAPAPLPL